MIVEILLNGITTEDPINPVYKELSLKDDDLPGNSTKEILQGQQTENKPLITLINYQSTNTVQNLWEKNSLKLTDIDKLVPRVRFRRQNTERNYVCEICEKRFAEGSHLRLHMRTHTGLKPYSCEFCKKSFSFKHLVKSHIQQTHTLERPHCCPLCPAKFVQRCGLANHLITHTGKNSIRIRKKQLCKKCGKVLSGGSHLQRHIRIHKEEKPHPCPRCGKCFGRKDHLQRHLATIHDRQIICAECGKFFNTNYRLKKHEKEEHEKKKAGTKKRRSKIET